MNGVVQALPFAGVLLSFAILPGLLPRFWHRHLVSIICAWIVLGFLVQTLAHGVAAAVQVLCEITIAEFLPFMVLLLALYALGGGIAMKGGPWGRPGGNLLLLVMGTQFLLIALLVTLWAGQDATYSPGWAHPMLYWDILL